MSSVPISNRELQELVKSKVSIKELTEKALQYELWSNDVDFNTVGTLEMYLSSSWAKEVDNLFEATVSMLNTLQKKPLASKNCDVPNSNSLIENCTKGGLSQNIQNDIEAPTELLEDFVDDLTALKNQTSYIKKRQNLSTEILEERRRVLTFERPNFRSRKIVPFCRIYDHSGNVIGDKSMFALTGNVCCGIPIDDVCVSEKYCKHEHLRDNGVSNFDIFANNNNSNFTIDGNNNSLVVAEAIYFDDENNNSDMMTLLPSITNGHNNSFVAYVSTNDGNNINSEKRASFVREDHCGENCRIYNAKSSLEIDDIRYCDDIPRQLDVFETLRDCCNASPLIKHPNAPEKVRFLDIWSLDARSDTSKLHYAEIKRKKKRLIKKKYGLECQSKPDLVIKTIDKMQINYDVKKDPVNSLSVDKLARKERRQASEKIGHHREDGSDCSLSGGEEVENLFEKEGFCYTERRFSRPYNTNDPFDGMFDIVREENLTISNKVVPDNNEVLFHNVFTEEEVCNVRDSIASSHFSKYWMTDAQYSVEIEKMFARVQNWFDNGETNVEENEESFDQRSYECSVLEKLEKTPIMSFHELCAGIKRSKICNWFITCLNLVNSKNIQLIGLNAEPLMMDVAVFRLLSVEHHYKQLNKGLMPIASSSR